MTTTTGKLHFTVNVESLLPIIRQAYFMENKHEWALATLKALGVQTDNQVQLILKGEAKLINSDDEVHCIYRKEKDQEWIDKLNGWKLWRDTKAYKFGDRYLPRDLVDAYVNGIVKRLRNSMRMRFVMDDPVELVRLEQRRQQLHKEIIIAAGFEDEVEEHHTLEGKSEAYIEFDREFDAYLNKQTAWLSDDYSKEI